PLRLVDDIERRRQRDAEEQDHEREPDEPERAGPRDVVREVTVCRPQVEVLDARDVEHLWIARDPGSARRRTATPLGKAPLPPRTCATATRVSRWSCLMKSAQRSPIITMPAWQLPDGTAGITLASAMRSPWSP